MALCLQVDSLAHDLWFIFGIRCKCRRGNSQAASRVSLTYLSHQSHSIICSNPTLGKFYKFYVWAPFHLRLPDKNKQNKRHRSRKSIGHLAHSPDPVFRDYRKQNVMWEWQGSSEGHNQTAWQGIQSCVLAEWTEYLRRIIRVMTINTYFSSWFNELFVVPLSLGLSSGWSRSAWARKLVTHLE